MLAHGFRACPRLECLHPNCNRAAFCYRCRGPWNPSTKDSNGVTSEPHSISDIEEEHACFRNPTEMGGESSRDRSMFSWFRQIFQFPNTSSTGGAPADANTAGNASFNAYAPLVPSAATARRVSESSISLIETLSRHTGTSGTVAVSNPRARCPSDSADEVQPELPLVQ